jgi:hypothetical protein
MNDTVIIALAVVAVIALIVIAMGPVLKKLNIKFLGTSIEAQTHKPAADSPAGAHQKNVKAGGRALARDGSGRSATQEDVEAQGDAEAIVDPAPGKAGRGKDHNRPNP